LGNDVLILSDDEVKRILTIEDALRAVEDALREKGFGRTQMPPKPYIFFKKYNGDFRTMPSYLEELDPQILKRAKIVVDDFEQSTHSGEINVPLEEGIITIENIYGELSEVVIGKKGGRTSEDEITVFDSTGLSLQDITTATVVFEKARKKNMGKWLSI